MHSTPRTHLAASLLIALVIVGCSAAVAPTPSPTPFLPGSTPTPVPGDPGGSGGGTGGGVIPPGGPVTDPILGPATLVSPVAGQRDPHPVSVQLIRASVDGRHVQVELRWWSGVAPCSVLDSVTIERSDDARTIALTAIQGSGPEEIACIDIAQLTATIVDLGDLAPGSWTISAAGDAQPVVVAIS